MKLYFIAGENSGDFIGAKIIKAVKEINPNISIAAIGGSKMIAEGVHSLLDFQQLNLMGFIEILPHIFQLKKLINIAVENIINSKTNILITIDSPGFTFRVAKKIKKLAPNIKLVHIVAPSVWAYMPRRAEKYAKIYDKLLTLLPFEPPYFTKHGLSTEYIGHPVLEQEFYSRKKKIDKDIKVIAITPGSRKVEIDKHMPLIKKVLDKLAESCKIEAIFVQPNERFFSYISTYLEDAKFNFRLSTDRLKIFALCDVALAKSGTNTLEIAASGAPMIIGYKLNNLTFMLLKRIIKVKYASIINIIPNKEIIPEYIQENFTVENIVKGLTELLFDELKAKEQVYVANIVLKNLGLGANVSPSQKAAKIILEMI